MIKQWVLMFALWTISVAALAGADWSRTRNGVLFHGIEIHNAVELEPTNGLYRFCRLDARSRGAMSVCDRRRAFCASGVELRFKMRSPEVRIVMGGLDAAVCEKCQVYRGDVLADWPETTRTITGTRTELLFRKSSDDHLRRRVEKFGCRYDPEVVRVVLPPTDRIGICEVIGEVEPPSVEKLPARTYLAYGSSITHGSVSLLIQNGYVSRVGEALGTEVRNLGFAGSAFMQPEVADFIAGESFDFCSLEMGVNTIGKISSEEYEHRVRYMIKRTAESHPAACILVIDVFRTELSGKSLERVREYRHILKRVVCELALPNVRYVNGLDALPERGLLTTGSLHPSPQGHEAIAEYLVSQFREIAAMRRMLADENHSLRPQVHIRTDLNRNATEIRPGLLRIGALRPRNVREVGPANWTIDAGPVDRDFVDFERYREFLPALGVAKIRIMTGWAKSERIPGKIDITWLDRIVDWCCTNAIVPVLELSYGNPIYPGAGGAGLRDGIPNTAEGLVAWDRWVDFLGGHFKGRVNEWSMWNEPDINPEANTPAAIAAFNVRSAKILKRHIPDCRLHGLSLAHNDAQWLENCLRPMGDDAKLFDTFVYHGYVRNPDVSYPMVERQKAVLASLAPHARLRQGENGCASEWLDRFSLRYWPWSELSQAKWNLRRMLGDLGHDVESGLFCFTDINYRPPTFPTFYCNRKGYLRTGPSNEVLRVKRTYYAVQNAVSVFDATVTRIRENQRATCADRTVSLYEYQTRGGSPLLVFWDHGPVTVRDHVKATFLGTGESEVAMDENAAPGDSLETRGIEIGWRGPSLVDPVWVDLMTGWVYELPGDRQLVHDVGIDFVEIPCYDSPCLLTERKALKMIVK